MRHKYSIGGMSCGSCVAKVKSALLTLPDVLSAEVDKETNSAIVEMDTHIPLETLQAKLKDKDPKYSIAILDKIEHENTEKSWVATYKPILLIFFFITTVTLLIQYSSGGFDWTEWMRHFMAGFFLVFSFFKFMDLKGFADSYMTYDIIAKRFKSWGLIYPFVEFGLGILYLLALVPFYTNLIAFTVMTLSLIGVVQSVMAKKEIQCACLGAVFNLPMSTVTIIEDGLMILMSGFMLYNLW